jgi:hypothetical protein
MTPNCMSYNSLEYEFLAFGPLLTTTFVFMLLNNVNLCLTLGLRRTIYTVECIELLGAPDTHNPVITPTSEEHKNSFHFAMNFFMTMKTADSKTNKLRGP